MINISSEIRNQLRNHWQLRVEVRNEIRSMQNGETALATYDNLVDQEADRVVEVARAADKFIGLAGQGLDERLAKHQEDRGASAKPYPSADARA